MTQRPVRGIKRRPPGPKTIAWLRQHIPAFEAAYTAAQRVAAEEVENRLAFPSHGKEPKT